jgi:hypothetical protein
MFKLFNYVANETETEDLFQGLIAFYAFYFIFNILEKKKKK